MDGTGISPDIDVSPASLAFGDQLLGNSAVLPVTVRNLGTAALNVSNIASSNADYVPAPASFALAPGGTQVVDVTFTPTTTGPRPSTLTIVHNDQLTGSPSTVPITGTGINPAIALAPATLAFGSVQVGTSADLTLTVSNTGSTDLVVSNITSDDGRFAPDITSFAVAPGGNRVVTVTYTPGVGGAHTGTLSLAHNAAGSPSTVAMSGSGVTPGIDVSPASLAFGSVAVGGSSALALTITNTGTSPLNVANITSDDGQYVPDLTTFVVAPAANRVVNVTFTPTATGSQPATLSIAHNAAGSPTPVPLSGTGTSPDIQLSPAALDYGNVAVGSSGVLGLTVTNTGAAPLSVTSVTSDDGQFVPAPVAFVLGAGASQVVNVTFTPAGDGAESGTLSLVHNAVGSPATVPMSGTGTSGAIGVAPASLAFGSVVVGSSADLTLVVSNTGAGSLTVTGITSDDAQFSASPTAFIVAAGANRVVTVSFAPTATGAQGGNLSIAHNAAGSPTAVPVGGTGTSPVFGVAPAALAYGDVALGSPSVRTFTVTNTGTAPLNVSSVASDDGQFTPDIASFAVAPGGSQAVNVTFVPDAEGLRAGTVTLVHDAAGSPDGVAVSGTGTSPGFALAPPVLDFGDVILGSASTLAVTVSNPGNRALEVTNITSGAGQFVPDITFFTVPALGNRVVNVTFTPSDTAPLASALEITHNATGSPGHLPLSGTGVNPGIEVSRDSLAFGNVVFGNTAELSFRVTNIGGAPLNVSDISASDPQFVPDVATLAVPPGAKRTVTITFTPDGLGDDVGILFITHDALGGAVAVPMTGAGTVDVQAAEVLFGSVAMGSASEAAIPVRNPDANPVTITSVISSNSRFNPRETSLVIPAGATDTLHVIFLPTQAGGQNGFLSITHNPTITVPLSGTGLSTAEAAGGGTGVEPLIVPFGGEFLSALALMLYALFRRR